VLHFHKLSQQRKIINENESSWPAKYSKSRESTLSFDTSHKQVHNINSDGCRPSENWEKNFRPPRLKSANRTYDSKRDYHHPRGSYSSQGCGRGRNQDKPLYCMFHEKDINHRTRGCPIFLESKKKMTQKHNHPSNPASAKEVNHRSHWHQASQSSSSHQPSYQHSK
jgi:hypothetical protein